MEVRLGQRLIDAALIGAERAAALQQQRDAFEGRALGSDVKSFGSTVGLFTIAE